MRKDELLTPDELHAMDLTAELTNMLSRIVGDGRTRGADMSEFCADMHRIQNAILSQAAARAYPDRFRLLGGSVNDQTSCS